MRRGGRELTLRSKSRPKVMEEREEGTWKGGSMRP